jgi:glycerophosphoryl diester phosphodiesterase
VQTVCSLFNSWLRKLGGRYSLFFLITLLVAGCASGSRDVPAGFDLEAHRGGRGLAPENTLAAFSNAIALGVTTLELDIGLTADGVVVISHDTVLNPDHTRDANGAWLTRKGPAIHALTLAELQRNDVGRINPATAYGTQFALQAGRYGERIPTLASLFERMHALPHVRFNIETKVDPTRPYETAAPEPMVRALLAEIDKAGMGKRVTVQSFDWRTLALVGRFAPDLPRSYLTSPRTVNDARWTAGLPLEDFGSVPLLVRAAAGNGPGPITWSPAFAGLQSEQVDEAHQLGLAVLPWTVNEPRDMERLMDMGVDGLITDYPDMLRDLMRSRGLPLPASALDAPR